MEGRWVCGGGGEFAGPRLCARSSPAPAAHVHAPLLPCCPQVVKLKKMIDHWKEQAGLPPHKREYVDLEDIRGEWRGGRGGVKGGHQG